MKIKYGFVALLTAGLLLTGCGPSKDNSNDDYHEEGEFKKVEIALDELDNIYDLGYKAHKAYEGDLSYSYYKEDSAICKIIKDGKEVQIPESDDSNPYIQYSPFLQIQNTNYNFDKNNGKLIAEVEIKNSATDEGLNEQSIVYGEVDGNNLNQYIINKADNSQPAILEKVPLKEMFEFTFIGKVDELLSFPKGDPTTIKSFGSFSNAFFIFNDIHEELDKNIYFNKTTGHYKYELSKKIKKDKNNKINVKEYIIFDNKGIYNITQEYVGIKTRLLDDTGVNKKDTVTLTEKSINKLTTNQKIGKMYQLTKDEQAKVDALKNK